MSRFGAAAYPVGKAHRVCSATQRPLRIGERFVAALVENDAGGVERRDYSVEAWEAGPRPVERQRLVGFWRSVVPPEGAARRAVLDDQTMLDLFEQTPADQPARAALRFVLALMMVRRRVMLHEGVRGTSMLLRRSGDPRPPEGPPLIEVADPGLDESTIAQVIAELEGLSAGGEPGEAPATTATAETRA